MSEPASPCADTCFTPSIVDDKKPDQVGRGEHPAGEEVVVDIVLVSDSKLAMRVDHGSALHGLRSLATRPPSPPCVQLTRRHPWRLKLMIIRLE